MISLRVSTSNSLMWIRIPNDLMKKNMFYTLREIVSTISLVLFIVFMISCSPASEQEIAKPSMLSISGNVQRIDGNIQPLAICFSGQSVQTMLDQQGSFQASLSYEAVPFDIFALIPDNGYVYLRSVTEKDLPAPPNHALNLGVLVYNFTEKQSAELLSSAVSGSVIDTQRNPISHVFVSIPSIGLSAMSDENGFYSFAAVPEGKYQFQFSRLGYKSFRQQNIVVKSDEPLVIKPLALQIEEQKDDQILQSGKVNGRISLKGFDGKKLSVPSSVRIRLLNQSRQIYPDVTGHFSFDKLPYGNHFLQVELSGFTRKSLSFYLDSEFLQLPVLTLVENVNPHFGTIKGNVIFPEDAPDIAFVALKGTPHIRILDTTGEFEMTKIKPGRYDLVVKAEGYEPLVISAIDVKANVLTSIPSVNLIFHKDPPRVISSIPYDGQDEFVIKKKNEVFVLFNKKMKNASTKQSISIYPPVSYDIFLGKEHPQSDWDTLMIQMYGAKVPKPLHFQTTYTVTVSQNATDMDGSKMEEDFVFSFTTGSGQIIQSSPRNGYKHVASRDVNTIEFAFNCRIDESSFVEAFSISPTTSDQPTFEFFESDEGWTIARAFVNLYPNKDYQVALSSRLQTWDRVSIENTPYQISFSTNETRSNEE